MEGGQAMSTITLRPNGTTAVSGTIIGAGSAHAACSDNSDSTYIQCLYFQGATFGMDDLTLPSGAMVKSVSARARMALGGGAGATAYLDAGPSTGPPPGVTDGYCNVANVSPLTYAVNALSPIVWTDADVDAISLLIRNEAPYPSMLDVYEAYLDVVIVAKPVVVVNTPTGTITTTNSPDINWTNTLDTDGGPQTKFTVKVFNATQYSAGGFDPETSTPVAVQSTFASFTSLGMGVSFPNDTYRAYAKVEQTINGVQLVSAWAFSGFVINVTLPAVPTLTLTPNSGYGRIQINVLANSGSATTDALDLERSLDGGITWTSVRLVAGLVDRTLGVSLNVYDYEAPAGITVGYRARALHNYSGLFAASAWTTASTTWTSNGWWVKHPLLPDRNLRVLMRSYKTVTRGARQGVFQGLGALLPIVITDTRAGAVGSISIDALDLTDHDALTALVAMTTPLLLQGPANAGEPDRYVMFGDQASDRIVDNAKFHRRTITLPWTEVAKPAGPLTDFPDPPPPP